MISFKFSIKLLLVLLSFAVLFPYSLNAEDKIPVIIETREISVASLNAGRKIYMHYCIPCHGVKGNGKGFNSEYLDPKPANHTNAVEMSKRTDEKLYDTISGGGKSVGKSTYMPPWGGTFNEKQIESLILHLRKLCNCEGPD